METFKMKKISFMLIVLIAILGIFLTGCSETTIKYQCQDGTFKDTAESCSDVSCLTNCPEIDYSKCPQTKCPDLDCSLCPVQTKEITRYQCQDGTVKEKLSECVSVNVEIETLEQNEPDLSITINNPSESTYKLHNPTVTSSNQGGTITNLVMDVELYKNSELIRANTGVAYLSGSTRINSIEEKDSVKGYLNVHEYDLTKGTYTLRVIARKGASATPLATAEKQVTFS